MQIGILALQGDYEAHGRALEKINAEYIYVRKPQHLYTTDGLIIPGGESTVMLKLLNDDNFFAIIKTLARIGKPLFGTCAGAILLAKEVINPQQESFGLVDVTIERNGFGRQLSSQIVQGMTTLKRDPLEMVFIRAPRIHRIGRNVKVLATYENEAVCVEQDHYLLATFHPELTQDVTLHQYFVDRVAKNMQDGSS